MTSLSVNRLWLVIAHTSCYVVTNHRLCWLYMLRSSRVVRWRRRTYQSRWVTSYTHIRPCWPCWLETRAKLRGQKRRATLFRLVTLLPPNDTAPALSHEPTRLLSRPATCSAPKVSHWLITAGDCLSSVYCRHRRRCKPTNTHMSHREFRLFGIVICLFITLALYYLYCLHVLKNHFALSRTLILLV